MYHESVPESNSYLLFQIATAYSLRINDFLLPRFNSVYYGKHIMHLSMFIRCGEGRAGIGSGFDSSCLPLVGTFGRIGLSNRILLQFTSTNSFGRAGGAPPLSCTPPPPPPPQLNIDRCIRYFGPLIWSKLSSKIRYSLEHQKTRSKRPHEQ